MVHELGCEFELENISVKKEADLELINLVCKESILKTALEDFHSKKQFLSKHFLEKLLISDGIIEILRKTIRKMNPDIKIDVESVKKVLSDEVI